MKHGQIKQQTKNERGIALIAVMGLLILAAVLTASAVTVSKITAMVTAVSTEYSESVYAAESAAARIEWYLLKSNPQSLPMLGEVEAEEKDKSTAEITLSEFRADGSTHDITSGGKQSTVQIFDMRSGIDISGGMPNRDLLLYNTIAQQLQSENEVFTDFQDALMDYVDSDDNVRLKGAEKAKYAELNLPNLPRNSTMQFREEVMLIPGCEKLFKLDQENRLSVFRIIAPPGLRSNSGNPSIFTAGKYQIMGRCDLPMESVDKVMEALRTWRKDQTKLSELLDPDIMTKLRSKFSFKESGFYTIKIKPKPARPDAPVATLVFSCYIGNTMDAQGTRYYQYFIF